MKNLTSTTIAIILSLVAISALAADVNKDDAATIKKDLYGVGIKRAELIVAERKANGPFKDGNDLITRIKGIGTMTIKKNADTLTFGKNK